MRIALGLEYDGSSFCGWQTQPGGCGVQDALERALVPIAGTSVKTVCAGRTDTAVHATGQVVHFDAPVQRPLQAWVRGVNAHLPDSVGVLWARETSPQFHARFDAVARRYRYVLLTRAVRPGLLRGKVGWWHGALDIDALRAGAAHLIGRHDFSSFRAAECQARSPVRELTHLDIDGDGTFVTFDLRANAFLQHMVRNIVGALVYVGAGRRPDAWMAELLAARNRTRSAPTFAPDGLYLTAVEYSPAAGLPASF
ncbi:MAG: tRNA pseudouridine(38-40) synthase TruA [Burkholderiales bacterium]|nr:tRNA pseudouridine(38-40) synthase TruA [Burkholderiales bacterium]